MTLENTQHEKFAQLVAGGMDKTEAYQKIYNDATRDSAYSAGARLFGIVRKRVRELQALSETHLVMDMQERRERLARITRADLASFDTAKDGDLIQEIDYNEDGTIKKIKLPGKRECILADAQLAGEMPEKQGQNINVGVSVNVVTITEERRRELIEKKRAANERLRAQKAKAIEGKAGA